MTDFASFNGGVRHLRHLIAIVLLALGMIAAPYVQSAQAAGPDAEKAEPIPIKISWIPGSNYRLSLAAARGLFAKHGLDAEMIRFASGPAMNAAYKSGSVDIGFSGPPGVLTILSTGADIKAFFIDNDTAPTSGLVGTPGSNIRTIADLKGKSVALPRGTVVWVALVRALEKNGLSLDDVNVVNMGVVPAIAAFQNKEVDAVWVWSPVLYELLSQGGIDVARDIEFGHATNYWITRTAYLEEHPEAIQRFLAAMDEAEQIFANNPAEAVELLSAQLSISQHNSEKILSDTTYYSLRDQVAETGPASLTAETGGARSILEDFAKIMHENGILRSVPDVSDLLVSEPVETYLERAGN